MGDKCHRILCPTNVDVVWTVRRIVNYLTQTSPELLHDGREECVIVVAIASSETSPELLHDGREECVMVRSLVYLS